jgi:hypothetical protein
MKRLGVFSRSVRIISPASSLDMLFIIYSGYELFSTANANAQSLRMSFETRSPTPNTQRERPVCTPRSLSISSPFNPPLPSHQTLSRSTELCYAFVNVRMGTDRQSPRLMSCTHSNDRDELFMGLAHSHLQLFLSFSLVSSLCSKILLLRRA